MEEFPQFPFKSLRVASPLKVIAVSAGTGEIGRVVPSPVVKAFHMIQLHVAVGNFTSTIGTPPIALAINEFSNGGGHKRAFSCHVFANWVAFFMGWT